MSLFTLGWLAWFAWFAIEEALAFHTKGSGNTLSEHIWAWFGIRAANSTDPLEPITGWVRARRFTLLAFMAWLLVHFLTGGWF